MRAVRLTDAGREERARLDEASDALAGSLLAPLGERQRERLVEAMATVERLLTAGLVEVAPEDPVRTRPRRPAWPPTSPEIDERFEHGLGPVRRDPARPRGHGAAARADPDRTARRRARRLRRALAPRRRRSPTPSGCGSPRGRAASGLGRRLLAELERHARAAGVRTLRLDTNRALTEAIGLYRAAGFEEIERFNDEPHADHFFAKPLG